MTGRLFREFSLVDFGCRGHLDLRGADHHSDAGDQDCSCGRRSRAGSTGRPSRFFVGLNRPLQPGRWPAFLRRRWSWPCRSWLLTDRADLGGCGAAFRPRWRRWRTARPYYDQHARGRGRSTYEYMRDYTEDINRLVDSLVPEAECHYGPRVERERQRADFASGYRRPATATQMEIAEELSAAVRIEDQGARFRAAAEHVRRPPRPACPCSTCCRRPISRQLQEVLPGIHGEGLREPRFPDGRRGPEVQQARGPHHDQPRQGRPAGRQHARHRADVAIRTQRPASWATST